MLAPRIALQLLTLVSFALQPTATTLAGKEDIGNVRVAPVPLHVRRRGLANVDSLASKRSLINRRSYLRDAEKPDAHRVDAFVRNQVNPYRAVQAWGKPKAKRQQASITPTTISIYPTLATLTIGTSYTISVSTSLSYELSTSLSTSILQSVSTSLSTQFSTATQTSVAYATTRSTITSCVALLCNTVTSTRTIPTATATLTNTLAVATSTILSTVNVGTSIITSVATISTFTSLSTSTLGTSYQVTTSPLPTPTNIVYTSTLTSIFPTTRFSTQVATSTLFGTTSYITSDCLAGVVCGQPYRTSSVSPTATTLLTTVSTLVSTVTSVYETIGTTSTLAFAPGASPTGTGLNGCPLCPTGYLSARAEITFLCICVAIS